MATPTEKIAASLDVLRKLQKDGRRVLKSEEISRVHRERLLRHGVLQQVMKGWLVRAVQDGAAGEDRSFWDFCARYCTDRFGTDWHVSPEQSMLLQTGTTGIPRRLVVYTPRGTNNSVELPFGTSIYDLRYRPAPPPSDVTVYDGVRVLAPAAALMRIPESFFRQHANAARLALESVQDASVIVRRLLDGGHSVVAGRLAGAFRQAGRADVAADIVAVMKAGGYDVRETDPFAPARPAGEGRVQLPSIVARIQGLWEKMREVVVVTFPAPPAMQWTAESYLRSLDELYRADAYHSLALEGYRVPSEVIDRVSAADPPAGGESRATEALAARGYWRAFQSVKATVARVAAGEDAGVLARTAHEAWYAELLQPFAAAADHPATRDDAELSAARHAADRGNSVRDALPALFDLMEAEREPSVRAVLGHWMFGYIHLYPGRDGRVARFLMNVMLASGGYPWTLIRADDGVAYAAALESASLEADIRPLARFIADRVRWAIEQQQRRYA